MPNRPANTIDFLPGTRRNQDVCANPFRKPTWLPIARDARLPSALTNMPPVGSMTSSRESRETAPENTDSLTRGKIRSMVVGLSSSLKVSSNVLFLCSEYRPLTRTVCVSRFSTSALTPRRSKLKLDRTPCSAAIETPKSALTPKARGSRYEPTTRYSAKPNWVVRLSRGRHVGTQTETAVQVDRAIASAEIPPADLEEAARCELVSLARNAELIGTQQPRRLEPGAVPDRQSMAIPRP